MIRGIFTGTVALDYAQHRHPLWLKELEPADENAERQSIEEEPPTGVPDEVTAGQGAGTEPRPPNVSNGEAVRQDCVEKSPPDVSADVVEEEPEAQKPL